MDLEAATQAGTLVAIEDVGLGGAGVSGLDQDLLDHVLDVLDAGHAVAVEVLL